MKISGLSNTYNFNVYKRQSAPKSKSQNLNFQGAPKCITFPPIKTSVKTSFETRAEAMAYYTNLVGKVNGYITDGKDETAFKALGYNVKKDSATNKITVLGDYKPRFKFMCNRDASAQDNTLSYEEMGLDEKRLFKNVERVTGVRYVSSNFIPNDDFEIDKRVIYPEPVAKRLDKILARRARYADNNLRNGEYQAALELLGYKTKSDKDGNLTIKEGYSPVLMTGENGTYTLERYGIDENKLLSKVVKIEGEADLQYTYQPDHYIDMRFPKKQMTYNREMFKRIVFFDPPFVEYRDKINALLDEGKDFEALAMLRLLPVRGNDGKITLQGGYNPVFMHVSQNIALPFNYDEMGIDENILLANVDTIEGDIFLSESNLNKLNKNLKVKRRAYYYPEQEERLFKDFISSDKILKSFSNVTAADLAELSQKGELSPSIAGVSKTYFGEFTDEDKKHLAEFSKRKSYEILMARKEAAEKSSSAPKNEATDTTLSSLTTEKNEQAKTLKETIEPAKRKALVWSLAWNLSKEIKQTLKGFVTDEMKEIIYSKKEQEQNELTKLRRWIFEYKINLKAVNAKLLQMGFDDREFAVLSAYFKHCFAEAQKECWIEALNNAEKAAKTYEENGIDGIQDEKAKAVILKWKEKTSLANS